MCVFFKYFKYYSQNNQTHRNISKYLNNYVHKNLQPCLIFYKSQLCFYIDSFFFLKQQRSSTKNLTGSGEFSSTFVDLVLLQEQT